MQLAIKNVCLKTINGKAQQLNEQHAYFYQIQCQLAVTNIRFCEFGVWTEQEMFVQRIYLDNVFIKVCLAKVDQFFKKFILPELLGKYFSRKKSSTKPVLSPLCFCNTNDDNKTLIKCSFDLCKIVHFHKEYMGLK